MKIHVISHGKKHGAKTAQVVLHFPAKNGKLKSVTAHLQRVNEGQYVDRWGKMYEI